MAVTIELPAFAPPAAAPSPRRSLVLAGGGMRVAWQAGVLKALHEAGLRFFHADGTSGGTMNLAMILSGLTPDEMCRRWRSLPVRDFVSLLPLRDYLKGMRVPALGDADGIVQKVFPHLGIDPARVRVAQGMAGYVQRVQLHAQGERGRFRTRTSTSICWLRAFRCRSSCRRCARACSYISTRCGSRTPT